MPKGVRLKLKPTSSKLRVIEIKLSQGNLIREAARERGLPSNYIAFLGYIEARE